MNDNYFPKDQIVLTENEKQQFLKNLPSIVSIDEGINKVVQIVNDMPYFLTQSSCEGQGSNQLLDAKNRNHMPVPYIAVGVLYNAFELLDELADFLWSELRGKMHSLSFDAQVQAINEYQKTKTNVPNFQRFLSIFLKNKRAIPLLEEKLIEFSKKTLPPIETNVEELEQQLVDKYDKYLVLANQVAQTDRTFFLTPNQRMDKLVERLKMSPALSFVAFREEQPQVGFPKSFSLTFYVKDQHYLPSDLFDMLCSFFTGRLIVADTFQATTLGTSLRKISLSLFEPKRAELFARMTEHWAEIGGRWENSPYWG